MSPYRQSVVRPSERLTWWQRFHIWWLAKAIQRRLAWLEKRGCKRDEVLDQLMQLDQILTDRIAAESARKRHLAAVVDRIATAERAVKRDLGGSP